MKGCEHPFGWTQLVTRVIDCHVLIFTWCSACRDYVAIGPSTDTPATAIELRAADLAIAYEDPHYFVPWTGAAINGWTMTGKSEPSPEWHAGYLARCIATHKDSTP